ncbi:MAG: hypothetical protein FWE06_01415 [Oscillospiraceae bacterium]|nr:hypothetical protein [Oscillospiraceae bacterium]
MKTLVVYYSRTGHCKALATTLADAMNADCERLLDVHPFRGPFGFIRGIVVGIRKKLIHICPPQYQPREYDQIVMVTPVWVNHAAPAIRSYVDQYGDMCRKLQLFTISKQCDKVNQVSEELQATFGLNVQNTVGFTSAEIKKGDVLEKLKAMGGS